MAWETPLDRLLVQQIQRAEKGEVRAADVREQILSLQALAPDRPATAFHVGFARVVLGLDLPEVADGGAAGRWYLFGQLRGHDRRGERNWVADLIQHPTAVMDLLQEPQIAAQALPLVMRTLFWCGDLDLAVKAIGFLAADDHPESEALVDAALTDLLARLEARSQSDGEASRAEILGRVIAITAFARLPEDVRCRYHLALAAELFTTSEFDEATTELERAMPLAQRYPLLSSKARLQRTLARLRLPAVLELRPCPERDDRAELVELLGGPQPGEAIPETWYALGILAFESGDLDRARRSFEQALSGLRRLNGRDNTTIAHARFYVGASILAGQQRRDAGRAVRLIDQALDDVVPDLESFYPVHEALKELDRKVALRFLDAVDLGRGTSPDQLLIVALEYLSLGEAGPASAAAERVLQIATDLDQRVEALRTLLTARNMQGRRDDAREVYEQIRDVLMQRGAFDELEKLLQQEDFVGQALDHVEIKCELVDLYDQMEGKEFERAQLQSALARAMRARKDAEALQQAFALLEEVAVRFPDLARDELDAIGKLLQLGNESPADAGAAARRSAELAEQLGHAPRVLVVGGNERQRRHHPRFAELCREWGIDGEWWMANYSSPQKLVGNIADRIGELDMLLLLHWNRHETTEPALEIARKANVPARTVHYAGFTSLQVSLADMLDKLAPEAAGDAAPEPAPRRGKNRSKSRT